MDSSDLEHIEVKDRNPFVLFNEWMSEYKKFVDGKLMYMNLATADKDATPNNRTLLLEDVVDEKFIFFTSSPSPKINHIEENPKVSITIFLQYRNGEKKIDRQIRSQGIVRKSSRERSKYYYDRKPLFCKIRSHLTKYYNQSSVVDWEELKNKHDELLKKHQKGEIEFPLIDTQSAYEITPINVQFYSTYNYVICDRVVFTKNDADDWEYSHVMA